MRCYDCGAEVAERDGVRDRRITGGESHTMYPSHTTEMVWVHADRRACRREKAEREEARTDSRICPVCRGRVEYRVAAKDVVLAGHLMIHRQEDLARALAQGKSFEIAFR